MVHAAAIWFCIIFILTELRMVYYKQAEVTISIVLSFCYDLRLTGFVYPRESWSFSCM